MARSVEEIKIELIKEYTAKMEKAGKSKEEIAEFFMKKDKLFDKKAEEEAKKEMEKEKGTQVNPAETIAPEQEYMNSAATGIPEYHEYRMDKTIVKIIPRYKEISVTFPIAGGNHAKLTSTQESSSKFAVRVWRDISEIFKIYATKPIYKIGLTNRDPLFKMLYAKLESSTYIPALDGDTTKDKIEALAVELQMTEAIVKDAMKQENWGENPDENKEWVESTETPTWAELIGNVEEFHPKVEELAREMLEDGTFLKKMISTPECMVVGQKDKITLACLIALSSCIDDLLHSLAMGSPGTGKSSVGEHVFKIFPKQRRFEFTAESTVAGLMRATQFAEGDKLFRNKLIYIGDLGNEDQQKNPKVQEFLSMTRILMEGKPYTKILTDMSNEERLPMILTIDGCGSVLVECTSKTMEAQFEDRCVRWSPNSGKKVKEMIDAFHNNELEKSDAKAAFNKKRPIVACAIELLFQEVEKLRRAAGGFTIYNPYNEFLGKIFTISTEVGNRGKKNLRTLPKLVALANLFKKEKYWNENKNEWAIIVEPEDIIFTLKTMGKAIGYMLSPVPENVLSYIENIEEHYIEGENWPYTFKEYMMKFNDRFVDDDDRKAFREHKTTAKYITAKDMGKIMSVQDDTARGYLNDLVKAEMLYVNRPKSNGPNLYYPVNDFENKKGGIGAKYPKPDDIETITAKIKGNEKGIQEIYDEFKSKMVKKGYRLES